MEALAGDEAKRIRHDDFGMIEDVVRSDRDEHYCIFNQELDMIVDIGSEAYADRSSDTD